MIAPPEGDMAAYMSTLERLAGLDLAVIYPGHGPEIERPAEKLAEYIQHRLMRERQVLAALAAGAGTPEEIRARVYEDLDPRLFGHLMERLLDEGARDVYFAPIQMKKNRPGTLVVALSDPARAGDLGRILLDETTTLGYRWQPVGRVERARRRIQVACRRFQDPCHR